MLMAASANSLVSRFGFTSSVNPNGSGSPTDFDYPSFFAASRSARLVQHLDIDSAASDSIETTPPDALDESSQPSCRRYGQRRLRQPPRRLASISTVPALAAGSSSVNPNAASMLRTGSFGILPVRSQRGPGLPGDSAPRFSDASRPRRTWRPPLAPAAQRGSAALKEPLPQAQLQSDPSNGIKFFFIVTSSRTPACHLVVCAVPGFQLRFAGAEIIRRNLRPGGVLPFHRMNLSRPYNGI